VPAGIGLDETGGAAEDVREPAHEVEAEPQAGAARAARRRALMEHLEDDGAIGGIDARAGVGDAQDERLVDDLGRHDDFARSS
jgi:hypothetical protein